MNRFTCVYNERRENVQISLYPADFSIQEFIDTEGNGQKIGKHTSVPELHEGWSVMHLMQMETHFSNLHHQVALEFGSNKPA